MRIRTAATFALVLMTLASCGKTEKLVPLEKTPGAIPADSPESRKLREVPAAVDAPKL